MRARQPPDGPKHLLHRRRRANDLGLPAAPDPRDSGALDRHRSLADRAAHDGDGLINIEGLRQVFEGAALKRRHGPFQIGVGGHDDDRDLCEPAVYVVEQGQAVRARHADVADDGVGGAVREPADRAVGVFEADDVHIHARQGLL